jgi:arylamine N-acetyltransferase
MRCISGLLVAVVFGAGALAAPALVAQTEQEKSAPNEADQILRDSQKQNPETPKELEDCLQQWDRSTQMTKEEWAASCRNTLKYFPETTPTGPSPKR